MDGSKVVSLLMVSLLLLTAIANVSSEPPASRGPVDNTDSEPNGDVPNATNITLASANINGALTGADSADVYKVWMTNSGGNADTITIIADFDISTGISIEITDQSGFQYFAAFDNNADAKVLTYVSGYTQHFYINLSKQFGDPTYTLSVNKVNGAYQGNGNNHPSQAATSIGDNIPVTNTLDQVTPKDHQDFYKVSLASSGSASDLLVVFLDQPATADYWLQLYKSAGGGVYSSLKMAKGSQAGANVTLSFGATVTGDVYVRVFAFAGSGQYTIYIQKTSIAKDSSNAWSTATPITLAADHTAASQGEVGEGIDSEDWYSLSVVKNQFINVSITSTDYSAMTKLPQIFVSLIRADHVTEYSNPNQTDSQADPNGYTNGTVPDSTGTNYIKVYALGGGGGGRYSLGILTDKVPTIVPGSVVTINVMENTVNSTLDLDNVFDDPDASDTLAYSYEKVPGGTEGFDNDQNLSISIAADGKVTVAPKAGTPRGWTGSGAVTFTAVDDYGMNATATFAINVKGANHAPFVKAPYNATASFVDVCLLTYGDVERNGTIDLKSVFGDNDTGDKLRFELYADNPIWIQKDYQTVLGQQVLNGATVNDSIRVSFTKEANLVDHKGPINIYITDNAKTTKQDHDSVLYFEANDNGDPSMASVRVKLVVQIRKAGGNLPEWKDSFTKVQFNEDNTSTVDLDTMITDVDAADNGFIQYDIFGLGDNLTATKTDRSNVVFGAQKDWSGEVYGVRIMATDTFGLTANTTIKVVVLEVADGPVEDPAKTTPPFTSPVTVDEGGSTTLTIGVYDPDSQMIELVFEWKVDGVVVSTAVNETFIYKPGFDSAGAHKIEVTVKDNTLQNAKFNATWDVTVNNVNRAPTGAKIVTPANNASFKQGSKIEFKAQTASDPDKDTLTYTWYMDDVPIPSGNQQVVTYSKMKVGTHKIKLVVSDGKLTATDEVTIKIKKKPSAGVLPGFEASIVLLAVAAVAIGLLAQRKKR